MLAKKILVPLDGSELAERITLETARLAREEGASLLLVRVVATPGELAAAGRDLEAFRACLAGKGVTASARVVQGDPVTAICSLAGETGASLVALATHGREGVERLARGSVAEEVLRRSPVPVLVANPFALAAAGERTVRKILVPLDGSTTAASVLPAACELARIHSAELVLFRAVDLSWSHYPEIARPHVLAEAQAYLAREKAALPVPAITRVVEDDPAEGILAAVAREGADLVAIASHGRTGLARLYYGSVAEATLRRCSVPLLVVRSVAEPERAPAPVPGALAAHEGE